jgi:hypothetical protein
MEGAGKTNDLLRVKRRVPNPRVRISAASKSEPTPESGGPHGPLDPLPDTLKGRPHGDARLPPFIKLSIVIYTTILKGFLWDV